jgi:signal transduction histidine kinase
MSSAVVEAIETRRPVLRAEGHGEEKSCSVLALPILHDIEPLGVLLVEAERRGVAFQPEEVEFCQVIANAAASALKNARQYESLVEIERAKSEFLANLSHELRTPLSAIVGYAELAAEQAAEQRDEPVGELVSHISRSAVEMARHVESLLRLSQVTLGRERKQVGRVDLATVLGTALEGARRLARRGAIEFGLEIDPAIGEIYTDGEKLQRIVEYILVNAVKFTDHGSVRISAALVKGGAQAQSLALPNGIQPWERVLSLSIQDTGIGIDRSDLAKIFQDFQQADGSTNRPYAGLGIGLAVSRRLAEVLGGVIRVDSRPGEGSVFEVLVPIQVAA